MQTTSLVLALVLGASGACVISSNPATPPGGPTPPATPTLLSADGTRFATSRHYQGECMPAGSRGGCYSIDVEPDGSYRQWLLDAAVSGTYTIAGGNVTFTPSSPADPMTLALAADGSKLGDYVYQPPAPPTTQGPTQIP